MTNLSRGLIIAFATFLLTHQSTEYKKEISVMVVEGVEDRSMVC
jgi:hypothetical protein